MDTSLAQEAISEALKGNWEKAVELNKKLLKENKDDVEALNRLSRAYAELGKIPEAKKISSKVIKLDPFNKIAKKCLDKYKGLNKNDAISTAAPLTSSFIEEPGKTKMVTLMHVGADKILAKLDAGDEVRLDPHGHRISIVCQNGKYIGRLPDDIGARLKKLLKLGNSYKVYIKSLEPKLVKVFIKETRRAPSIKDIPSFPAEKIDYVSFIPPELVHKKEGVAPLEDEELN